MTKTILVADDSKTIQTVVALTFRATDFRVIPALDAEDALRRLQEARPDVVLADVSMPGRNGYELCSQLKSASATAGIPVLLLTGGFEPFDERRAQEARADGHIKKPFDSQSLIERVKALVANPPAADAGASAPAAAPPAPAAAQPVPPRRPSAEAHPPAQESPPRMPPAAPRAGAFAAPVDAARPAAEMGGGLRIGGAAAEASVGGGFVSNTGVLRAEAPPPAAPGASPASPFGPPRADSRAPVPPFGQPPASSVAAFPGSTAKADARAGRAESVQIEEPEIIEDAEVFDDGDGAQGLTLESTVPSLEPPSPPGDQRNKPQVDMWALADVPEGSREREEVRAREAPRAAVAELRGRDARSTDDADLDGLDGHPGPAADLAAPPGLARDAARSLGRAAAEPVAAAAQAVVPGLPRAELIALARETIERIAWEVVPDLAETIIRAEIARLLKERGI